MQRLKENRGLIVLGAYLLAMLGSAGYTAALALGWAATELHDLFSAHVTIILAG